MTGTEVQQEIIKRNAETRLIMVTAFGTISVALEAIQAGASAVAAGAMFQFTDQTPKGAAQYLAERGITVRL